MSYLVSWIREVTVAKAQAHWEGALTRQEWSCRCLRRVRQTLLQSEGSIYDMIQRNMAVSRFDTVLGTVGLV